jgi:cell wall-associated NlpC family hydrolase
MTPIVPVPVVRNVDLTLEAAQRRAVIVEARSWDQTPYREQADRKGEGVDCAMLIVRAWIDAGVFEPFDPRPYPPNPHMSGDREYLGWLEAGATEVERWQPGDIVVWEFGRSFSHSGVVINAAGDVVHALKSVGKATLSGMNEAFLTYTGKGRANIRLRPRKFFDPWAPIRAAA